MPSHGSSLLSQPQSNLAEQPPQLRAADSQEAGASQVPSSCQASHQTQPLETSLVSDKWPAKLPERPAGEHTAKSFARSFAKPFDTPTPQASFGRRVFTPREKAKSAKVPMSSGAAGLDDGVGGGAGPGEGAGLGTCSFGGGAVAKKGKWAKAPCLAPSCGAAKLWGCWCHIRSQDAMKYQADHKKIDGESLHLMNKLLSLPAGIEVEKFGKQNPPGQEVSSQTARPVGFLPEDFLQEECVRQGREHQAANALATPKIFTLDIAIPGIAEIALHTAQVEQAQQATLYSEPCVLRDMPEVALWLSDHVVQMSLTSFACGYSQKAETTAGRTKAFVDAKQGKAATAVMFDAFLPTQDVLDIARDKTITGGQAFMDGLWMFGFSPDMKYSGFTPNNSACLRALALGEVKILLVDVQSLVKVTTEEALTPGEPDRCKDLSYLEELNNWDDAKLKSLVASGVRMKRFVQKQGDLLYIPQGYLIIESTMPGQSLVYGVRKSLMMKGGAHASAYSATTELFRASQRNCERMDLIFEMMKE